MIGVSGGLDSTQALIVCGARDGLARPAARQYPGLHAARLRDEQRHQEQCLAADARLGVTGAEIDIRPAARQMLADLGHPFADGEPVYDVTFENVQAGLRTDYLFRLANHNGGLVVGTGDLSELALGWCTYGVGDQMSHYNVECLGVEDADPAPDPLRRASRRCRARRRAAMLHAILGTEISPELVPAGADGAIQSTESMVGPYALQDFNLFYMTRYGFRPSKIAYLSWNAWGDAEHGRWPANIPACARRAYRSGRDQALAARVPARGSSSEPVQALGHAERAEDLVRRLAVAARRLARAVRFARRDLARRTRAQHSGSGVAGPA